MEHYRKCHSIYDDQCLQLLPATESHSTIFHQSATCCPFHPHRTYRLTHNGVSAIDGGFIQILATATASATIDKAAAGGCLGGEESVPKSLRT